MSINITLYSDIACPWCLIGMHRLNRVIERDYSSDTFNIEHHPVILMPDIPASGVRMNDYISKKYGLTDPAQAWASSEAEAKNSGINFDHRKLEFAYRTDRAHSLIRFAHKSGRQHEIANALYGAYLLENLDISNLEVLSSIGERFGLVKNEVEHFVQSPDEAKRTEELAREAAAKGVTSIPHYIFGSNDQINGNISEKAISEHIRKIRVNTK